MKKVLKVAARTLPTLAGGEFLTRTAKFQLIISLLGSVAAYGQSNMVLIVSPAAEFIGQGQTNYTTNPGAIVISGTAAAVTVTSLGFTSTLAGPGGSALTVGQYSNVVQYPFNGSAPGLNVSGFGRNCTNVCGSFQVLELQTNDAGQIEHFWATFSQDSNCSKPPLTGELRYNSLLATNGALPRTLRVPQDFPTIQAALDDTVPYAVDTVIVDPGLYIEAVQFGARTARLVSSGGPSVTCIMAPGSFYAVSFGYGTTAGILSGFTISNTLAGITVNSGRTNCGACPTPTISSNVIVNCGTGIDVGTSSPRIRYNHIMLCPGNAIRLQGTAAAFIEGNLIEQNGTALTTFAAGLTTIHNNIVRNNGSGLLIDPGFLGTDANISQNLIVNNANGGVYFPVGGRGAWLINNTIAGNGGAGIDNYGSGTDTRIINNIVVGDPALWSESEIGSATIQFNDFYSRNGPALAGAITNLIGLDGNISTNPFFACEPAGDFHLVAASPAIDVGTNGAVLLTAFDLDGRPRILPGHTNGPPFVDLGAYEFDPASQFSPCVFLICPSNIVLMAAPGWDSAVVNYPAPYATPGATVTTSAPSGSSFPAGDTTVNVSAQFGTNITSCSFMVTVITDHDLARALNATNLPWVSFGDIPWFAQNGTTHDGVAAAQSGPLTNIQTSTLRTVLQGPGPLSFWWKLNAFPGSDYLYLTLDGTALTSFSGISGWQSNTFNIPPGPHIVDWTLARRENYWPGQTVQAWLDQVSFPVGPIPFVLVCPSNMVVVAAPGQYSATVNYPPPFATPGATVTTSPPSGSAFPGGDTTVNVTAVYGTNTTNCSFTVSVRTAHDFGLALNTTNIDWITAGDASWYMETNVSLDGIAAQSGAITNNQASTVQTTLTAPGTLTFWWKVSSQTNHDLLYVTANGSTQAVISGQVDWQPRTLYLASGTQLVQWTYAKDASGSAGQDAAWLDEVSWTPGAATPSIISQPASLAVAIGNTATFSVTAGGTPPLTYQWLFNGENLPGATASTLVVTNVQAWNTGNYTVAVMNQVGTNSSATATLRLAEALAWGSNSNGQTNVPPDLTNVAAIAGGWHHSMALQKDGVIRVWGSNNHGQTNVPAGLSNTVGIASRSGDFCAALLSNGTVVAWGDNSHGETNVPPGLSNVVAISAGGYGCLALKSDSTAVGWGNLAVPAGLSNLVAVSAGDYASLFLRADGTVAATGTTVPPYVTNIVQLAAGGLHNLALRANGTVVGWGDNSYGQISIPTGLTQVVAIAAGDYHSTALRADHTVVVWGRYYTGSGFMVPMVPTTLTNVLAIAAGSDHDLALVTNTPPLPFITAQPVSQTVVAGSNATFSVTAGPTGSGLSYQWLFNSSNSIPYATNSTLVLSNVQSRNAGVYSVQVTNPFGSTLSSNATLLVEHPPMADASATPSTVISTNSADATVILDGSRSSEPDGDALQYLWLSLSPQPPTVLTNGVVAVVVLPLGVHPLALVVNDGLLASTNPITVSVFTPSEAVVHLNTLVTQSVSNSAPLTAILQSAQAALSRGDSVAAVNQLLAFQKMVRVQVAPSAPALAEELISAAQQIIDSLQGRRGMRPTNLRALNQQAGGKLQLRFSGTTGQIYVVEASTNLLDWAMIGTASQQDDGEFHFEDANAAKLPNRFYRVLKP